MDTIKKKKQEVVAPTIELLSEVESLNVYGGGFVSVLGFNLICLNTNCSDANCTANCLENCLADCTSNCGNCTADCQSNCTSKCEGPKPWQPGIDNFQC